MQRSLRGWLYQAFLAFKSCPQYHVMFYAFVLMYDIEIKFDIDIYFFDIESCKITVTFSTIHISKYFSTYNMSATLDTLTDLVHFSNLN